MKKSSLILIIFLFLANACMSQDLSIEKIFSMDWGVKDALTTQLNLDGNYSFTSYEVIQEKKEIAFLSAISPEIIIYRMSGAKIITIPIEFGASDFTYSDNKFFVQYEKSVLIYNTIGERIQTINLQKSFDYEQEMRVIDGELFILTADERTYHVTDNNFEEVANRWIFGTNKELKVTINRETSTFFIEGKNEAGEFSGNVDLHSSIASVTPIGIIGDQVFLSFEKFTNQSPLQVESRLLIYSVTSGNLTINQKVPNVFYSVIKNSFEFSKNKLFHIVSTPTGIKLFQLTFNSVSNSDNYPIDLLNSVYHYNDHLASDIQSGNYQQLEQGGSNPCSITQTQVENNALAYRDFVINVTSNSLRSPCTDRCQLGCRASIGSYKVVTPPYITGIGSYTGVPYKWGGYTALSNFNTYANQGRYVGNYLTTAMTSGIPSCPTAPNAHGSDSDNDVIGVDCSGFISRVWNVSHYTTNTINSICTNFPITASQMEPGDIWNKAGSHVRMFLSGNPTGTQNLVEATTGGLAKVRTYPYIYTSSWGYVPYRYNNICTSGGTNPVLNCQNAFPLTCGVTYNGASSSATSNINTYGCNNWTETGPERIHTITTTSTGTITATLSNFSGDLDVYILGSCDPSSCLGTVSSSSATYANAPAGTYYIVVDADDGSGSSYSLLVNCTANTPNTPDLSVSNTTATPSFACPGNLITVTSYVNNSGTGSAGASTMRYYLSTNSIYDAADVILNSSSVSVISAGGSSSQISASLTIPGGTTPGSYYILYYADIPNSITETNENNNVAYRVFSVSNCTVFPDLIISNPSLTSYSMCAGNNVSATCDIENIGGSASVASTLKYFLSANSTYDASDLLLINSSIGAINNGAATSQTSYFTIPSNLATGTWYILTISDFNNNVNEGAIGESNNLFYDQIQIINCPGLPDLTVHVNNYTPNAINPGTHILVDYTAENIGSVNISNHKLGIYISDDNVFNLNSDEFLGDWSKGGITAGQSYASILNFDIPNCYQCGTFYIFIVIDYQNIVSESDESNNYDSFQIAITGCTACFYNVPPTGTNFQSGGGTGNFTLTSTSCCEWSASTVDSSWITILNDFGYGTSNVNYSVAPCSGGGTRTGTIAVAGQTHTITQNCTQACNISQSFEWGAQGGSSNFWDYGYDLIADASGNIYMTGSVQGTATFGGITLTTPSTAPDIFISKHNSLGQIQWAINYGNTGQDQGIGIAKDNSGNIYIVGSFNNSITLGSTTLTSNGANNDAIFIAQINASNGSVNWAKKVNANDVAITPKIAIDNNNNIFVSGNLWTSNSFFVAKYNTSGTQSFYQTYGSGSVNVYGISGDNLGNILIAGRFLGSLTIGSTTLTAVASADGFVSKLNSSGTPVWVKQLSSPIAVQNTFRSVVVDNSNNIYVIGNVDSTATIGNITIPLSHTMKAVIVKFDTNGNPIWAKASSQGVQFPQKIVKGSDNNLYFTGPFGGSMKMDGTTISSAGSNDGFIARIDTSGNLAWLKGFGSAGADEAYTIGLNNSNDVFVAGTFSGTVVYGSTTLTSIGSGDVFLTKFKQCDPPTANVTYTGNLSICNGKSVPLSTSYCSSNTYQWQLNNIDIAGATNPTYPATLSGAYRVKVSAFAGCETFSNPISVTVQGAIIPVITGNLSVCQNLTTQLNAGTGYSSYQWNNNSSQQSITVGAGSYTVTVTDANGCSGSSSVNVVEKPLPIVVANSSVNSVCAGSSIILSGSGANTYVWSNGVTNGLAFIPISTTTYTMTGIDVNGCMDTATKTITVNLLPIVTVNSPAICSGQIATLMAGGNALTYTWGVGATSIGVNTATVSPTVTATYFVIGTTGTCTDTAISTVTVNALPIVTVNSPTICAGQIATLNAGGNAASYTWSVGATSTGVNSAIATPTNTTTYTVTGTTGACNNTAVSTVSVNSLPIVTVNSPTICAGQIATLNAGGNAASYSWSAGAASTGVNTATATPVNTSIYTVTGTTGACNNTAVSTVTVNSLPIVTVNSPTICAGQIATLNAGGNATNYSWSAGANSTGVNTATASPMVTTSYFVTGTNGTCNDTAVSTVTVNPLPLLPTFQVNGNSLGCNVSFGVSYQWNLNGVPLLHDTLQFLTAIDTGYYSVTITENSTGCSSISAPTYVVPPTGIKNISFTNSINIYPNPTYDVINIKGSDIENGEYSFDLKDILGQVLFSDRLIITNNNIQKQFSLYEFSSGMYFLKIENDLGVKVIKIEKR